MVDWGQIPVGTWSQIASAAATTAAVFVALFREPFFSWWRRPKLTVRAGQSPPDIDKIPFVETYVSGSYLSQPRPIAMSFTDSYYLRLWIKNEGKSRAEKVQVFVIGVYREIANHTLVPVDSFLPMNLRWAFGTETNPVVFADGISPGMGVHCNFARVLDPKQRISLGDEHPEAGPGQTVLHIETELKPTNLCNVLPPGTYHLELMLAGANCKPTSHTVEITLTGKWFDDRERMLRDGVTMRVVNGEFKNEKLLRRERAVGKGGAAK
ncbi:MAG: hypothetical protein L0220_14115 [Acidobacteria bacterium]|nr:hypothetical protein [Acidobacteriota bacterium]